MCLTSSPAQFISTVNSFRTDLQEISLTLVGSAASVSLRKTGWKAHSGKAGKVTFPQLQCKLATTYFSDRRINFFFRTYFYGSRSLAENKLWRLNIFYWSHSLRIQGLPPSSVNTYTLNLFILLEMQNAIHMGNIRFLNRHKQKRRLFFKLRKAFVLLLTNWQLLSMYVNSL